MKRWSSILEQHENTGLMNSGTQSINNQMVDFLPLVTKAFVGSVALDLVPVIPMDGSNSPDEFKKMRSDIKIENRERRIDSVIGGIKIEEMKIEDHKDYKKVNHQVVIYSIWIIHMVVLPRLLPN